MHHCDKNFQKHVKSILKESALIMHDPLGIQIEGLTSMITSDSNMHTICQTYCATMPDWMTTAFL